MWCRMDTKLSSKWTYKCFYLGPKYGGKREDYVYNLNNFQFLFRELDSSAEESSLYNEKR